MSSPLTTAASGTGVVVAVGGKRVAVDVEDGNGWVAVGAALLILQAANRKVTAKIKIKL